MALAVVRRRPYEELAALRLVGPRNRAMHDVNGLLGRRGLDEPAAVFLADQGDREGLHYGQRSPRLNVIASNGRTLTGSSCFAHAMSTHSPSRSSNASSVRSHGSMSQRCLTPSRA